MYILSSDFRHDFSSGDFDLQEWEEHWSAYREYLASLRHKMPTAAYAFATADWHYSSGFPQFPHDAQIDKLLVRWPGSDEWDGALWVTMQGASDIARLEWRQRSQGGPPDLLLDAHTSNAVDGREVTGTLRLVYRQVSGYSLTVPPGDWRYDEVRLSGTGRVAHEIELGSGGHWLIESEDIEASWYPG